MGDVKVYNQRELMRFFQEQGYVNVTVSKFGVSGCMLVAVK